MGVRTLSAHALNVHLLCDHAPSMPPKPSSSCGCAPQGDLESCQLSEVPWEGGGGGERFYFENEQVTVQMRSRTGAAHALCFWTRNFSKGRMHSSHHERPMCSALARATPAMQVCVFKPS